MNTLYAIKPKRLFTFGCSFTSYLWCTWANILGYELGKAEFYNFGKSGAGNSYIFNMLTQADAAYNFTHEDLVIVQWTNVSREDRYFHPGAEILNSDEARYGAWSTPGNIYSQGTYNDEWIKKYFSEYGALVKDLAFIKASHEMLKHKTQWHFLQMNNLVHYVNQWDSSKQFEDKGRIDQLRDLYKETIRYLRPSFYEVLFNNNWNQKFNADRKLINKNFQDGHPSPLEHYDFLKRTFKHDWSPSTNKRVSDIQKSWVQKMHGASHNNPKWSIYSDQSLGWLRSTQHKLIIRSSNDIDSRLHH